MVKRLQNIASLREDFVTISAAADAAAAADQRISLMNHFSAAAQGAKASTASIRKLAGDCLGAMSAQKKLSPQSQKLAQSFHALFNGGHLSATQPEKLLHDVKQMLGDAGVSAEGAGKIVDDLKAIAAETK